MPWKKCSVMDERLQFVARRLAGESMAELCRQFGISRKTGYKIFDRYQETGMQGLTDRSRRPYRYANQLPFQVENFILNVRSEHPIWVLAKFASDCCAASLAFPFRPTAPFMPCWIVTDWSSAVAVYVIALKARLYPWASARTNSGAPTTRASFCWAIASPAIRSPSRSCQPLPAYLRSAFFDSGKVRFPCV